MQGRGASTLLHSELSFGGCLDPTPCIPNCHAARFNAKPPQPLLYINQNGGVLVPSCFYGCGLLPSCVKLQLPSSCTKQHAGGPCNWTSLLSCRRRGPKILECQRLQRHTDTHTHTQHTHTHSSRQTVISKKATANKKESNPKSRNKGTGGAVLEPHPISKITLAQLDRP